MAATKHKRDVMAQRYVRRHMETDPGTIVAYYLPTNSPPREIRLVEVNELMIPRDAAPLEPFDLGIDVGNGANYKLLVVDVTPAQWEKIRRREMQLPEGWSIQRRGIYTIIHASVTFTFSIWHELSDTVRAAVHAGNQRGRKRVPQVRLAEHSPASVHDPL